MNTLVLPEHGLNLSHYEDFLPAALATKMMTRLEKEITYIPAEKAKARVFGKWYSVPREFAAYGDEGVPYAFSGTSHEALPWTPTLATIRKLVRKTTGVDYNFVLVNKYANGWKRVGFHADDEIGLDRTVPIASVSLGATRSFILRHAKNKLLKRRRIMLRHGSLLLMNPPTNEHWQHAIPVAVKECGLRLNLTFRKILV